MMNMGDLGVLLLLCALFVACIMRAC